MVDIPDGLMIDIRGVPRRYVITGGVVVTLVASFIAIGYLTSFTVALTVVRIVVSLLLVGAIGFFTIPAIMYVFAPSLTRKSRQMLGRLHFRLQQLAYGKSMVCVWRSDGTYEFAPMRQHNNVWFVKLDGSWLQIERRDNKLHRFAGGWFCELVERGEQIHRFIADDDDGLLISTSEVARTDGGSAELPTERVDLPMPTGITKTLYRYNPIGTPDGYAVDLTKVWAWIKGDNQGDQELDAAHRGLRDAGGSTTPGWLFWGLLSIGSIILGAIFGLIVAIL